jgi:hypothetical protein
MPKNDHTALPKELRLPVAPHSIQKGSTLKTLLDRDAVACLAHNISLVHPSFDKKGFQHEALHGLAPMALLERGRHLAAALRRFLPSNYTEAVAVLMRSLTSPLERGVVLCHL